jgi:predicted dehydrogenase
LPRALSTIGAAVIGSGFIGTVHIEALRRIGVQVHGLLGSTPERGADRAQRLGVPHAYASLDELLGDERVEVVHVTSPNHLHHPQVKGILAADRHVICEKPLAMTSEQSAELVGLADSSGKVAAVNFNLRFYPLNQHARQVVREGALGNVRLVSGHYFQDWLLMETDWNWRLQPDQGGALRAVGDIGSHWLDLTSFITGLKVESVMADLATFIQTRQQPAGPVETFSTERATETVSTTIATEDMANVLLRYDNGARGVVGISQISPGRKNSLQYEIDGSLGAAAWDSEQPDQLWNGYRDRPNEILIKNPALMSEAGRRTAALPGGHVEGFADTFAALFRAVYADVGEGSMGSDPVYATFADGHEEMLVGDAIAHSSRTGAWTPVPLGAAETAAEANKTLEEARI